MNNLWFENSEGKERLIAAVYSWEDVYRCINEFIKQCNDNKIAQSKERYGADFDESKVRLFKSYYTRVWQQKDGRYRLDVGSHTEFFITDLPYEVKKNDNESSSCYS